MSLVAMPSPPLVGTPEPAEIRRAYLSAFWLRPENAMWMVLRSRALHAIGCPAYDLDLGCGDGLFSFLHMGGRISDDFDVFCSVAGVPALRRPQEDMFNHVDAAYVPRVTQPAATTIRTGADLKPALLAKAAQLRLYEELVEHDNNLPLPLPDATFDTVYCNTAYWLTEIDSFLGELRRIIMPGGRIILHVKLEVMTEVNLDSWADVLGGRFLRIIDAGRADMWPTVADRRGWESRFHGAGLRLTRAQPLATRAHARLWNVGLRPLAPLLARMANALDPSSRLAIKKDWIALFDDLLAPLCRPDLQLADGDSEPVEMQYELGA